MNAKKLLQELNEIIKKENSKWVLYSKKGKVLGRHKTKAAAQRQERAIQAQKARRG